LATITMQMMPMMSCGHGWLRAEEEVGRGIVSVAIAVPPKSTEAEKSSTRCQEIQRFAPRRVSRGHRTHCVHEALAKSAQGDATVRNGSKMDCRRMTPLICN
jgi:hypothetical protein